MAIAYRHKVLAVSNRLRRLANVKRMTVTALFSPVAAASPSNPDVRPRLTENRAKLRHGMVDNRARVTYKMTVPFTP